MKAVLLAGGFGTRLKPLTYNRPKPMVPLLNKPVIEHIIDYLRGQSITEILVTTNYMREQLIKHLGDGERYGVRIEYPKEHVPLGTAGSVKNIEDALDETFAIIQGDNITDMSLHELVSAHKKSGGFATIAVQEVSDPGHYGVVQTNDEGRVVGFQEKPERTEAKSNFINTGLYVMEPEVFDHIPEGKKFDFSKDLFPKLVEVEKLYARHLPGFWADVGDLEGYLLAKQWLLGRLQKTLPADYDWNDATASPLAFGQNVSIGSGAHLTGPLIIGENSVIENGCRIGPGTIIGQNVTIKRGGEISGAVVFEGTNIGTNARLSGCLLAEKNNVGSGTTVDSNAVVGAGCKLGWYVMVHENSRIWPNMNVAHGSTVSGTLRQFIKVDEGVDNPYGHLRTVSEDEAFYFNTSIDGRIIHTGLKARNLPEFKENLEKVDMECVKHHLRYEANDFRDWAANIICDTKLAEKYDTIKRKNNWWADENLKQKIVNTTQKRLKELYEIVYY